MSMNNYMLCQYTNVSTNSVICTGPGYLNGIVVLSNTTGTPRVLIYDATATSSGTIVIGGATTGTKGCNVLMLAAPVRMSTGIYASWVAGTSGADSVTVFFTKAIA
jgi:hypothetical protein